MTNQDDKGREYNQMYEPGPRSAPHSASPGGGVKLFTPPHDLPRANLASWVRKVTSYTAWLFLLNFELPKREHLKHLRKK